MTTQPADNTIEIKNVSKSFDHARVVDGISFSVAPGDIFGLIGPNGAGKTTTIRMVMDIIKPDDGTIHVLGKPFSEQTKDSVGYLPEERGLYKKLTVLESLCYLAILKGMKPREARRRADELLERTGLEPHRKKHTEELSRGMGQIVQFLTTIIHDPSLIIMDEPFANLDPLNTELLKEILFELKSQGKAIVLSTHRMNEVEELCNRIFMINRGRGVLYGNINDIKANYRRDTILIEYEGEPGEIPGVAERRGRKGAEELLIDSQTTPQQVLETLVGRGVLISRFEVSTPPLHDIFLQVVGAADA
ncbi:ABC transporter ATP-binding protein [Chloroflexota bacterium]